MSGSGRQGADWGRRYPPLATIAVALALAILALPSALNLPQANPGQTLEYAPVPGNGASQAAGNIAGLGLGTSNGPAGTAEGLAAPAIGQTAPPPPLGPGGAGIIPSTKQCVGNPPRQTEDPLSPPCVAFFNGDNGGSTYPGLTAKELKILVYDDGGSWADNSWGVQSDCSTAGQYIDLADPPNPGEGWSTRDLRRFQSYFNNRYQTYGRFVHFYEYCATVDSSGAATTTTRQTDAADNFNQKHPFSVLTSLVRSGHESTYSGAMAQHGVLDFSSASGSQAASFYQAYPGLIWSFAPTTETIASLYSSYVCREVIGKPVIDSNGYNGQARGLGLLYTSDPAYPELTRFGHLVQQQVESCGGQFKDIKTFPLAEHVGSVPITDPAASYATTNMADFRQKGVTTILWAGGYETYQSKAATRQQYFPEWVLAGLGGLDGISEAQLNDQNQWAHAWVTTPRLPQIAGQVGQCTQALREVDPSVGSGDIRYGCGLFPLYQDLRQLFTGIQVAGPRLTPATLGEGFRAIPARPGGGPQSPACFYPTGDYTCVKDATREWWDPSAPPVGPSSPPGCWRLALGGQRFLADGWPDDNLGPRGSDPCNTFDFANQF
ncbi:MAG: hypothetical protein ACYDGR_10730 [Candidatus Dormibacteria bacterium]